MTASLYAIGRFCSRRHYPVIAVWLIAAVALVLVGQASGDKTNNNLELPGTGSTAATNLLENNLPQQAYGNNPVVLEVPEEAPATYDTADDRDGLTLEDAPYASAVDETVKRLRALPHITSAVNPLGPQGEAFLSKNGRIGYIPVVLDVSPGALTETEAHQVFDATTPADDAGLGVSIGGYVGQALSTPSTEVSDAIGLAAAIVILLFAFGTATAMALPIIGAVVGLACSLSIIQLLENAVQVPSVASTLATMTGLGVGIDYSLFIVTRHKQQLREGLEMRESIARAAATAGGAVVFAGFTVVIALCSLGIAGIPLVTTLGFTAAISVVVAVMAATTLLPALLGALGPHIDSLRVHVGKTHPDDKQPHGWLRWARGVAKRPWRSAIAATAVLVALALPIFDLELGQQDNSSLPESTTARQAYDGLAKGFGEGVNGPLLIAAKFQTAAEAKRTVPEMEKRVGALGDVQQVSPPSYDSDGKVVVFTAISKSSPSSDETIDLVDRLRDATVPAAMAGTGGTAYVGGQTAGYIDLADQISGKLPMMIAIVVVLSFGVLLLAFRSLLVPLKAALMNLLSVAAAYGVLTAVFQLGWGSELIGLDHAIPIVSFVPLLMFAILFGLSMDYEMFLMTQISEHYRAGESAREAVVKGLAGTGRVITSAALIMVFVFGSFVLNGDPVVKEFGVGLAVAIALDATLVRCLLVPAILELLGDRAWSLPGLLDRILPRINIEGEEYFGRLDAEKT